MSNEDDDRALFEEALASMSAGEVYRGKFGAPDDGGTSEGAPDDEEARAEIQRLREEREMQTAFVGVDRIDKGKYHVPPPQTDGDADALRAEFEAAMAAPTKAPPEDANPPLRKSLAESAPVDVHTLNLRGFDPNEAIVKLGLFVDLASKDSHELIRVRIGSNPPLLDAVQAWFKDAGLIYLRDLEVVQAHADAAIFAQIRRTNRS